MSTASLNKFYILTCEEIQHIIFTGLFEQCLKATRNYFYALGNEIRFCMVVLFESSFCSFQGTNFSIKVKCLKEYGCNYSSILTYYKYDVFVRLKNEKQIVKMNPMRIDYYMRSGLRVGGVKMKNQNKSKKKKITSDEKKDLKKNIEKQIEAAVWLQTFGLIAETILTSKLLSLDEEDMDGEQDVFTGILVQAIGQLFQSIGVSQQISAIDKELFINGQKIEVTGNFIQLIGVAMTAFGGERELLEELQKISELEFIP